MPHGTEALEIIPLTVASLVCCVLGRTARCHALLRLPHGVGIACCVFCVLVAAASAVYLLLCMLAGVAGLDAGLVVICRRQGHQSGEYNLSLPVDVGF